MVRYLFTWVRENRQIWHYKLLSRHEKWSSSILHLCEQTELRWWVFFVTKHDLPSLEIIKDDAGRTRREARRILHLFPRYPIFLLDGSASFQSYASTIWRFFAVVGALLFLIATITFITLPAIFIVDTDIDYFGNNHCLRVHNILGRILVLCPSSSRVIWCSGGLSRQQKGSDLWRYDVVVVTGHRRLLFDRNVPLCGNHQGVYT